MSNRITAQEAKVLTRTSSENKVQKELLEVYQAIRKAALNTKKEVNLYGSYLALTLEQLRGDGFTISTIPDSDPRDQGSYVITISWK